MPERQHVPVVDRVDDRVGVQPVAERLLGRAQLRVAAAAGVLGEDRRAGEAEQVVALERLVIAVCMSPNWLRWHSSKISTTWPS